MCLPAQLGIQRRATVFRRVWLRYDFVMYSYRCMFFCPMPSHVHVDFVVLPPGHGWDAHEAQLRCPGDVSGDIGGWSARRALKPKFY